MSDSNDAVIGENCCEILSAVIPVYRTPLQLLRNCLDSVLKYSQPMELICVLDSPGDPCEAVLDEYVEREPRMRLLKNDRNRGVSHSRNRGMDAAKGDCVTFVDADDEVVASVYERQYRRLHDQQTDAEIIATRRIDESAVPRCHWGVAPGDGFAASVTDGDDSSARLVNVSWLSAYPIIFKREALLTSGARFIEGKRYGEDYVFLTQFLCSGARVGYQNVCGYVSVGHPNSACQIGTSVKRCLDTIETAFLTWERASERVVNRGARRIYLARALRLAFQDFSLRSVSWSNEDRQNYCRMLNRFLESLKVDSGDLGCFLKVVARILNRYPRLMFCPLSPVQWSVKIAGILGLVLK